MAHKFNLFSTRALLGLTVCTIFAATSSIAKADEEMAVGCAIATQVALSDYKKWYTSVSKQGAAPFEQRMEEKYRKVVCGKTEAGFEVVFVADYMITDHVVRYQLDGGYKIIKRSLGSDI